ncbi:MAG: SDR family oxidoreductase [Lachnospiraceae bacterium]|nr:SDR family oxidoreductase [Lachnospiraceae bacterium]
MSEDKAIYCRIETSAPNTSLQGQTIVITGGGTGIGRAIAKRVTEAGAYTVLIGRREERLKAVADQLGEACCSYYLYDVIEADGSLCIFEEMENGINRKITGLVNNAGIYIDKRPTDFTIEDFDSVIHTNLRAPMFMTIGFLKYCEKNQVKGNIIMTASNRALFGDYGPYGVSKRGLIHYTQGLARELIGTGIRLNAVAPGMTASEINGVDISGNLYTSSAKGKRILLPEEIAEVVWFLLSNYSQCIHGAVIPCDEGDYLR